MTLPQGYKVSYAQNREDRIIEAFFPGVKKGFYVDVGANDPHEDSVTKLFYDKGWNGINIEPNSTLYEKLKHERKRDVNLQVGVSDRSGKIDFREYTNHGLSTFSERAKKQNMGSNDPSLSKYKDYSVQVQTLSDVLGKHAKSRIINFLKIDVEGYEYEVLAGNDWSKYRPELLCIEANHINQNWRPLLKQADYSLVFNDGLNEYYLRKESLNRREYFDYAETMILSGIIVNPGVAKRIEDAQELPAIREENSKLNELNASLADETKRLSAELARYASVKFLLYRLFVRLYRKVVRRRSA